MNMNSSQLICTSENGEVTHLRMRVDFVCCDLNLYDYEIDVMSLKLWRDPLGWSDAGRFWIYSFTLSVGGSVGSAGFRGLAFRQEPAPIIGSQAAFGNMAMGCK